MSFVAVIVKGDTTYDDDSVGSTNAELIAGVEVTDIAAEFTASAEPVKDGEEYLFDVKKIKERRKER